MTTDERQYRAALWAYWCAARNERDGDFAKAIQQRLSDYVGDPMEFDPHFTVADDLVQCFCLTAMPYLHSDDEALLDDPDVACCFSATRRAYSFRPEKEGEGQYRSGYPPGDSGRLHDELKAPSAAIRDTLRKFIGTKPHSEVEARHTIRTATLRPFQVQTLKQLLNANKVPPEVEYLGAWLVGYRPGYGARYVFGCRRHVPAVDLRDGERLWAVLQYPEVAVRDHPCTPVRGWIASYAAGIEQQLTFSRELFAQVCQDLTLCGNPDQLVIYADTAPAANEDRTVVLEPPESEEEIAWAISQVRAATESRPTRPQAIAILRAYDGLKPLKEWLALRRQQHRSLRGWETQRIVKEAPAEGNTKPTWHPPYRPPWRELILCTNQDAETAREYVHREAEHFAWHDLTVSILTPTHIAPLLERAPWVWSEYFGFGAPFHLVKDDAAQLRTVLVSGERDRRALALPTHVPHPSIADVDVEPGSHVCITGVGGSGKTTALYDLARRCERTVMAHGEHAVTIVLSSSMSTADLDRCWDALEVVPREWHRIVVVDNLERAFAAPEHALLPEIVGWMARQTGEPTVLVAHESSHFVVEHSSWLDRFTRRFLGWDDAFVRIALEQHLQQVFPERRVDEDQLPQVLEHARVRSVGALVTAYLYREEHDRDLFGVADGVAWWAARYRRVNDPDQGLVLRFLAGMHGLSFPTVSVATVKLYYEERCLAARDSVMGNRVPLTERSVPPVGSSGRPVRALLHRLECLGYLTLHGGSICLVRVAMSAILHCGDPLEELWGVIVWLQAHLDCFGEATVEHITMMGVVVAEKQRLPDRAEWEPILLAQDATAAAIRRLLDNLAVRWKHQGEQGAYLRTMVWVAQRSPHVVMLLCHLAMQADCAQWLRARLETAQTESREYDAVPASLNAWADFETLVLHHDARIAADVAVAVLEHIAVWQVPYRTLHAARMVSRKCLEVPALQSRAEAVITRAENAGARGGSSQG